ncbi:MAG: carboxypeptidase regulatory-like domain-containing protein, partial [Janthinobacterium lividum]
RIRTAAAAFSLIAAPCLHAQTITATVNGAVTDRSGAVLPHATVTARNTATGVETTVISNDAGEYSIRFLQIGQYTVTVKSNGFQTFVSAPFTLEVNQFAKIDAPLQVGAGTETVSVSSETQPILDTENATISGTFSANTLQNMPINDRNFSSVTEFVPGAVTTQPTQMEGVNAIERDTNQGGQVSINGNRNQTNNYLLDGVEINETINNVIGYNESPDAIENLTVITSNAPAEYGNVNGGDVILITKSGTNHFHGSAFAFLKNYNLDANSWANNLAGVAKQPFTQTIFGGTLGGPIIKDKLFFFIDYEAARFQTGGTEAASVIPAAFRAGDFSSLPTQLFHYVAGQGRVNYVNNQVPVTNPVAQFLFAHPNLYPLPNKTPIDGIAEDNYIGSYKNTVRNDQGDIKIDYKLGTRDSLLGRYSQGEASDATPQTPVLITFPGTNDYPFKGFAFNEVHTFSSAIVNEFRAGWSRVRWTQGVPIDLTGAFGTTGNATVGINYMQPYSGFTLQDFGSGQGASNQTYLTGLGTTGGGSSLIDNTFTYADDFTYQIGKHTLRAGVEILRYQQNNFYPGNDGVMGREQYSGAFTGSTVSDFDSDQVYYAGVASNVGRSGQRQYRDAGFVQDDWKVNEKVTLNLGLRYEYDQPIYEVHDKEANVDLATAQYIYAGTAQAATAFGDGHALYNPVYTNFMPRIGFAYQAMPRFVVRGGYGITNYLEGTGANLRLNFNPPFQPSYTYQAIAPTATTAGTPLIAQTALPASFAAATSSNTLRAWDARLRPAFIQEFTLGTEYEVNNKTSLMVAYLGQTGQHLIDARAANQLTLAQGAAYIANGSVVNAASTAPYANLVGQTGAIVETQTESMMNYNAAQMTLRHRQSAGLEYTINYTFSKAMTNNPGFFGTADVNGASAYWQDAYNGHADYGPSGFDTRHNASATVVYTLPFGRGRQFGGSMNRVLDEAVGGWKITGAAIAYSGLPVTISGPDSTATNNRASRANRYQHLIIQHRTLTNWFGTGSTAYEPIVNTTGTTENGCTTAAAQSLGCAYGPTVGNEFGTASVGSERAPGFDQIDMTAGKQFHITEAQNVEFRADFFNVGNIAAYDNPDNGINDSSFGKITNVRSQARQIQFSLHYNF